MKVLMVNYEFPPIGGGAGQAHLNILRQFARIPELSAVVLTSGTEKRDQIESFSSRIRLVRIGIGKRRLHHWTKGEVIRWLWRADRAYRRILAGDRFDLVHAFFGFPSGYLPWRRSGGGPYLLSLRGSDVPGANPRLQLDYKLLGPLFRRIWRGAAVCVACSQGLARRAARLVADLDYRVIPNGVDTDRFHPARTENRSGPIRLLTVGRLSAGKRVDILIRATAQLCAGGLDASLTVAGDGALRDQLVRTARQLDVSDRVHFTGRVEPDGMPDLYRGHDLFLSASLSEGMSNAWLEAMASGLPIVACGCEGATELIDRNGIVIPLGHEEEFSDRIAALVRDPRQCRAMAEAAVARARQFSWQEVARHYIELYQAVLEGPGGGPSR